MGYTSGITKILCGASIERYGTIDRLCELADLVSQKAISHNGTIWIKDHTGWHETCFSIHDFWVN